MINIKYKPHKHQKKLHDESHRYIVVVAGRRFGKSVFARHHCLLNAFYEPGLYWIVNPTYRQGKQIHWHELKKEIPKQLISYKNEQELSIHLVNGSRIEIKGADNEDALRGVGLKGVVMDEAADQKPKVWEEIIRPTLIDSAGWAVFIGTPKGFNWFYDLYLRGQKKSKTYDPDWVSYQYTSKDNPYLKKTEIKKAQAETDEDIFAQEYLAQFKRYKLAIYSNFERKTHVVEPFDIPYYGGWEIYRGIDFGYGAEPTVCLWIAIDPENEKWYIINEYYETKDTSDYHCGVILAKSAQYPSATSTYGDPANPQLMQDWSKRGVYITPASREGNTNLTEWVKTGIGIIQEKIKISVVDQKPNLFVFNHCENLLKEIESYRWKEEHDGTTKRPDKTNDHGCFVAGTKVLTKKGWENIEDVTTNDETWTPFGWSKVLGAQSMGTKQVKDYGVFKGTPDHPILTNNGVKEVDTVSDLDYIMVWQKDRPFTFKEFLIGVIQTPQTRIQEFISEGLLTRLKEARQDTSTGRHGNITRATFLKDIKSITEMEIQPITKSTTSNLSLFQNMQKDTIGEFIKVTRKILIESDLLLKNGTNQKLVELGIANTLKNNGKTKKDFQKIVKFAEKNMKHPILIEASTAIQIAKQQHLEEEEVFNLATEHGMYFANGVLVSNCDALRYFAISYKGKQNIVLPPDNKDWSFI